jgi:hypothetical protein
MAAVSSDGTDVQHTRTELNEGAAASEALYEGLIQARRVMRRTKNVPFDGNVECCKIREGKVDKLLQTVLAQIFAEGLHE